MNMKTKRVVRRGAAVLAVVAVVVVSLFLRPKGDSRPAFDPNGTDELGYAGLQELLRGYVDVSVSPTIKGAPSSPRQATYLVATAGVTNSQRRQLERLATRGATVVYSDAVLYAPDNADVAMLDQADFARSTELVNDCDADLLPIQHVQTIRVTNPRGIRADGDGSPRQGCIGTQTFDDGVQYSFMTVRKMGDGSIVNLGDGTVWSNRHLASSDNAALAVALLAPKADGTMQFVEPDLSSTPDATEEVYGIGPMLELAPTWIKAVGLNAGLALLVFCLARSRRVGRPAKEPMLVDVRAAQHSEAIGNLLRAGKQSDQAAQIYRQSLREDLVDAMRVPPTISTPELIAIVSQRTGIGVEELRAVLDPRAVSTTQELLDLSKAVCDIEARIRFSTAPPTPSKEIVQ
jgi:hypothetical protein